MMHTRALVFPIINSFGRVDTLDKEKITNLFNETVNWIAIIEVITQCMECQGYDIFLWQSKHKEIETK